MKITTFNPQIITKDADSFIQLFEELGFERRHRQEGIGELEVTGVRMRDANGFYLDVSQTDALPQQALLAIRINVDSFDDACALLLAHGFKNYYGDHTVRTATGRSAMMVSPEGLAINLVEHIGK